VLVERAQARAERGHGARDGTGDEQREPDRGEHRDHEHDQHRTAGRAGARGGLGLAGLGLVADLLLELVVDAVEALEDRGELVRVRRAGALALLDAVDRLLPGQLDRLRGRGLELGDAALELVERALRLVGGEVPAQAGERLVGLGVELVDLLRRTVLGLQVPVLDVEVAEDEVAAGEEVLADGHELLERDDVAVGDLLGVLIDRAEAVEAHDRGDDEREDEESERGAQPRGQAEVQEGLHAGSSAGARVLEAAHRSRPTPARQQLGPVEDPGHQMADRTGVVTGCEPGAHE
jgi:hypothetical protein